MKSAGGDGNYYASNIKAKLAFDAFNHKGHVTRGNFSANFQHNKGCIASCENNCPCNTPFSQLAMQQNVALQVPRKVELTSTLRKVARQVATCNMFSTVNLQRFSYVILRCKSHEKISSCKHGFPNLALIFITRRFCSRC